ncbi:MAG TPA: hypothetical protein VGR21_03535 [Cryptosporangiaceae bacterium]|nr:hypothetical protein [Cryptosporangiaceae bacterium]
MTGSRDPGRAHHGRDPAGRDGGGPDAWEILRRRPMADRLYRQFERRQERVYRGVVKGRQSRIPTWVLAVSLLAVLVTWALFVILV